MLLPSPWYLCPSSSSSNRVSLLKPRSPGRTHDRELVSSFTGLGLESPDERHRHQVLQTWGHVRKPSLPIPTEGPSHILSLSHFYHSRADKNQGRHRGKCEQWPGRGRKRVVDGLHPSFLHREHRCEVPRCSDPLSQEVQHCGACLSSEEAEDCASKTATSKNVAQAHSAQ